MVAQKYLGLFYEFLHTSEDLLKEFVMNPLWKVYKSKVMKTLNPEMEEETVEEVNPQKA